MPKYSLTIASDDPADILALLPEHRETVPAPAPVAADAQAQHVDTHPAPAAVQVPTTDTDDSDDAPNASAPDVDKRGIPWDERIHAGSKAVNADGTWRYRRGTPKELIASVEAELQGGPAHDPLAIPESLKRTEQPAAAPAPAPIPVPTGAPAPVAPCVPAAQPVTYEQVIAKMTECLQGGKLAADGLPQFYTECGVSAVHELPGNQAALDAAWTKLHAL